MPSKPSSLVAGFGNTLAFLLLIPVCTALALGSGVFTLMMMVALGSGIISVMNPQSLSNTVLSAIMLGWFFISVCVALIPVAVFFYPLVLWMDRNSANEDETGPV